ncbi:MAG: SRPBCC domain-containing protein [Planctomycetes bacterium]|nr:SRPBCC domain-containing protein [Planctomycetota bacterium]
MPITSVSSDPTTLTLTVVADYPVPVERLWDAYADPRQLERFWGPPTWPATFTRHDMAVGGHSHYHMTGPDGTVARGWFRFVAIDRHRRIEVEDGFADADGKPDANLPTMRMVFAFEATTNGARCTTTTRFPSVAAMEQLLQMGMREGLQSALGQLDGMFEDLRRFAAGRATQAQLLGDTQVRTSRIVRGTVEQVWRAHHDPALLPKWLTGPDGWTMPVCEVATKAGDRYRYEWAAGDGSQRFGFEGELLESEPPYRAVTTERWIGGDGQAVRNELTLTAVAGGTLVSLLITYPSKELRDMVLGTGMTDGMEASYARLERTVLAR